MSLLSSLVFVSETVIRAISYTLVHSLWQGMILAVVAGAIVYLTKKTRPSTRYNGLSLALLGFTGGTIATFRSQLNGISPAGDNSNNYNNLGAELLSSSEVHQLSSSVTLLEQTMERFNQYAPWLVFAWMGIIFFKSLQLTAGLLQVHRLKTTMVNSPGEYWEARMESLCKQLCINKVVRLLESGMVQVPAVVGFLKPVILVPAGLISQLSTAEVEAILLHELAHIRRKDYLVNVLQHFVDIIFFFNPAVKWVSSLMKVERENCCDDIAVSQTNNKQNYISALVSFHEVSSRKTPAFVPAFAGEKNLLLNRIKRIIYNNNKTLNNMEKKFLAAGLIVTSIFFVAFTSRNQQPANLPSPVVSQELQQDPAVSVPQDLIAELKIANDTLPDKPQEELNGTINTTVNGKKYKIVTKNNEVLDVYVNDKKVAPDKMGEHKTVITKILQQSKADMANAEKDMAQAELDMIAAEKEIANSQKEIAQAHLEMEKAQLEMEIDLALAKKELEESNVDMEQYKKEIAAAKLEIERAQEDMKKDMAQAKIEIEEAKIQLEESKEEIAQARKDIELAKKDIAESKRIQEAIINDFVNQKLISSKADLKSYKLDNDELVINGVKQPAETHKKFKTKYVKSQYWSASHGND